MRQIAGFLLAVLAALPSATARAQKTIPSARDEPKTSAAIQVGQFILGPSVMFGNIEGGGLGLGGEAEYGIAERGKLGPGTIGLGFRVHTYSFFFQELGQNSARITPLAISGNYHIPVAASKLDPFIGLAIGYATASVNGESLHYSGNSGTYLMLDGGGRFYITQQMSIQAGMSIGSRGDVGLLRLGGMFRI